MEKRDKYLSIYMIVELKLLITLCQNLCPVTWSGLMHSLYPGGPHNLMISSAIDAGKPLLQLNELSWDGNMLLFSKLPFTECLPK